MLIDAPPMLFNTTMHNKHLSHLMAKSMNELAHKSPLILYATQQAAKVKNPQWACKKTAKTDIYDKHCRILLSGMPVMLVSACQCNMEESKTFSSCRVPGQKSREQANRLRKIS